MERNNVVRRNSKRQKQKVLKRLFFDLTTISLAVFIRFLFHWFEWYIPYGIDVLLFIIFGTGIVLVHSTTETYQKPYRTALTHGVVQIAGAIITFEIFRLSFLNVEPFMKDFVVRLFVAIHVLIIGAVADTIFLTVYSQLFKKRKQDRFNDELLDN